MRTGWGVKRLLIYFRAAIRLGVFNGLNVVVYRLLIKLQWYQVRAQISPKGEIYSACSGLATGKSEEVASRTCFSVKLFSHWPIELEGKVPDWFINPLNGRRIKAPERPWWEISDFDPEAGDIKLVWELSRMDWVPALARRIREGEHAALQELNSWLNDWCANNRPYFGPNWKCGQEVSIRVMNLAIGALLLRQVFEPSNGLRELIVLHLERIAPTLRYAMAQDNNHGTSEAAALFIGGSWLALLGVPEGEGWKRAGQHWLENRAARLIGEHGSFSQYSLNYHRVMLDTFCMVEVWRRHLKLPEFAGKLRERALAATRWMYNIVSPQSGDGPNVGANDGARLLQLADTEYRDHRPSIQMAMVLFGGRRAYAEEGAWNQPLRLLGLELPSECAAAPATLVADDGGFAMLRRGHAFAMLRYPRFRFRPSQADALHLDLWLAGKNMLRDAGTYSYNTDVAWMSYFGGTAGHNTVQFDERDQMPRLSRFLFGDWLKTSRLEALRETAEGLAFGAGYRDRWGASHFRRLRLAEDTLLVEDEVAGFSRKAVLRWRLAPGAWQMQREGESAWRLVNAESGVVLKVRAAMPVVRCELVEGWESRHYLEKTPLPVLEVEVCQPGTFNTEVHWSR